MSQPVNQLREVKENDPRPHKRRRVEDLMGVPDEPGRWHHQIRMNTSMLFGFTPICPQGAGITLQGVLACMLAHARNGNYDLVGCFAAEAPTDRWFCYQRVAEHGWRSPLAEVEAGECACHGAACIQARNGDYEGGHGPDSLEFRRRT